MTGRVSRVRVAKAGAALAALLALAPYPSLAQDGQFDLRTRASPTPDPAPTSAGPVDPDNPTPTARPRPQPSAAATPLEVPSEAPSSAASTPAAPAPLASPNPSGPLATAPARGGPATEVGKFPATSPTQSSTDAPSTPLATQPRPTRAVTPRNLDLVANSPGLGLWLALGALALLLVVGGWLMWSRYYRHRVSATPEPEIIRPRVPEPEPAAEPEPAPAATPEPAPLPAGDLLLALEATRMTATLLNTTLSYRLAVTNRSQTTARDVRIEGDMIAAHAAYQQEDLFGPRAAVLPELHRIAALAPGESATLSGDIRLPLVAITPIRRGGAAFFVPLARLRARGSAPTGLSVEGGGTFLVGQEPGANRKLQPFRLDLGPRNYSRLGQHLLPAA